FEQQLSQLPFGYDHKYTYSHFGFNLKMTDLQAAIGLGQVAKLPSFGAARRRNFAFLHDALSLYSEVLDFPVATDCADPSWFGMLLTVRENAAFTRDEIVQF